MSFSKYFKIDLHIHTDESNKTKDNDYEGVFLLEKIHEKLMDNDIRMFSFTDHNIFNVSVYKDYFENYNDEQRKLLIGVEFDIFKETTLLNDLKIIKEGLQKENRKYHALVIFKSSDIDILNSKLNEMYKTIQTEYKKVNNDDIDFFTINGMKQRRTSIDRIITHFSKEDYIIIAHGRKDSSIISTYRNDISTAQNMILLGVISSLEMTPNGISAILHFNNEFDKLLEDEYKGRNDIPYVIFSDNHEIIAYPNYKSDYIVENRPYTWVRGDLSFETIRLSFVDPESRIRIQLIHPSEATKYLQNVSFDLQNPKGESYRREIEFAPGINSIIGGRSSGKSLLLNAIMYNIDDSRGESRIKDYLDRDNKLINDGSILGKLNYESTYKNINSCKTLAYTQEGIVSQFDNDGKELSNVLPFEKFDFDQVKKDFDKNYKFITKLIDAYGNLQANKSNRNQHFLNRDISISAERTSIGFSYEDARKKIQSETIELTSKTKTTIKNLIIHRDNLESLKSYNFGKGNLFSPTEINEIDSLIIVIKTKLKMIYGYYEKVLFKEKYISKLDLKMPLFLSKKLSENDTRIHQAKQRLAAEVLKAKNYMKTKMEMCSAVKNIDLIHFSIESINKKITDKYILRTKSDYSFNKKVLTDFLQTKILNFNADKIKDSFEKMALDDTSDIRVKYKTNSKADFETLMKTLYSECIKEISPKYVIVEIDKERLLSSEHMSPGKKASIYLEIILDKLSVSEEPRIIIIDQPEDNLDNEFITDQLIDKFRKLRSKFQIILVTHNASIALNSDSDNIIIAESVDGIISYKNGAIEHVEYRKKICRLLDGGHYIFDKRYHKYDIPNRKLFEPISKEK